VPLLQFDTALVLRACNARAAQLLGDAVQLGTPLAALLDPPGDGAAWSPADGERELPLPAGAVRWERVSPRPAGWSRCRRWTSSAPPRPSWSA